MKTDADRLRIRGRREAQRLRRPHRKDRMQEAHVGGEKVGRHDPACRCPECRHVRFVASSGPPLNGRRGGFYGAFSHGKRWKRTRVTRAVRATTGMPTVSDFRPREPRVVTKLGGLARFLRFGWA